MVGHVAAPNRAATSLHVGQMAVLEQDSEGSTRQLVDHQLRARCRKVVGLLRLWGATLTLLAHVPIPF